jgi:hypothetical protein
MSFTAKFLEKTRVRNLSESSEGGDTRGDAQAAGTGYDVDGKFSYFTVQTDGQQMCKPKETVDENGKFSYHSSDMRPVPPGWYDPDKSKHMVPLGWYQLGASHQK